MVLLTSAAVRVTTAVVLVGPLALALLVLALGWGGSQPSPGAASPAGGAAHSSGSTAGHGHGPGGGPAPAPAPSGRPVDEAAQLAAVNHLLDLDQATRQSVASAVYDVGDCGADQGLAADHTALTDAASARDAAAAQVLATPVSAAPGGARLVQTLAAALRSSATADRDYAAWAARAAKGPCAAQTVLSAPEYKAAAQASTRASASKRAFLALWAPLAKAVGLPARTPDTI